MAEAKTARGALKARPMSPHLQVYAPLINMVMSIMHRITGAALYFGALILAWWLMAAASGPEYFNFVNGLLGTWLGRVVLLGLTWLLVTHALGGLRHFIWDFGLGYGLRTVDLLSWGSLVLSIVLTAVIWISAGQLGPLLAPFMEFLK